MKFFFGTHVYSQDRKDVGMLREIVACPLTREVTHLVVQKGLFFHTDTLVPATAVTRADEAAVELCLTADQLEPCTAEYQPHHFVSAAIPAKAGDTQKLASFLWTQPKDARPLPDLPRSLIPPGIGRVDIPESITVPPDDILLDPGCPVEAADGETIGKVVELITNDRKQITHIRVTPRGVLKGVKEIPILWVSRVEDNQLFLGVTAAEFARLPELAAE